MKKEVIEKFYKTYRLFIFPAGVALSGLILIGFVIYPQFSKLLSNSQVEGDLKTKSQFLQAKAQELENYDERDLNQKVGYVLTAYPREADFASIVGLMQNLANRSGFTITTLSFSAPAGDKSGSSFRVNMEAAGSNELVPALVTEIENSPRIMKVNSLELTSGASGRISMSLEVYYSNLPNTFGNADSPLPKFSAEDDELIAKLASSIPPQSQAPQEPTGPLGPRGKANPFE